MKLTRAGFLGGLAALAFPAAARGQADDAGVLNFALVLEQLQATLYREALELEIGADLGSLVHGFAEHEREHIELLTAQLRKLGAEPGERARFEFRLEDREEFVALAPTIEDTVVSAYLGAIPSARTAPVRELLTRIVHTEAQQASTLRLLAGYRAAPLAFDEVLSQTLVVDKIRPFVLP